MTPARITVPAVLNATSLAGLRQDLHDAFRSTHPVVLLEGSEEAFCRGLDPAAVSSATHDGLLGFSACLDEIRLGPKPVIALVDAPASAGGVGLAAAADLVLATPRATFALTELILGLFPAIIFPTLAARLGHARARLWALSCHTWSAVEAHHAGLVDALTPPDHARTVQAWTRRLARSEPSAAAHWKTYSASADALNPQHAALVTLHRLADPSVLARLESL